MFYNLLFRNFNQDAKMKIFSNLSTKDLTELTKYDVFELEIKLAVLLGESQFGKDLKYGAVIDCFTNIFLFGNEVSLSITQLSWLLNTQEHLLNLCEQGTSLSNSISLLHELIFSLPENQNQETSKQILDFLLKSFYQHYHLYQHMLTKAQQTVQLNKIIDVETVPTTQTFPCPLEESILESLYEEYLNPKPKEDDEKSAEENPSKTSSVTESQPIDDVTTLLASLKPDELRKLIQDIAESKFNSFKVEMEGKISDKETAMNKTFSKLHAR
ncbi:ciliary-associated calcium-binding coiled-coil protein 1-like [Clytia hemisphaerica]